MVRNCVQIKSNAVRALGSLSRYVIFANLPEVNEKFVGYMGSSSTKGSDRAQLGTGKCVGKNSSQSRDAASAGSRYWLERIVQSFLSCITTGNVKVSIWKSDNFYFYPSWVFIAVVLENGFHPTFWWLVLLIFYEQVQWNVCHALSNLFRNETLNLKDRDW